MFEKLVAPATEPEITKHWKYTDKIYVSVVCTTFNQEMYIRDAIESFLAQETEYQFEIIIHDDASTDRTPEIIKEYTERFPNVIKPLLQTENQYSDYVCKPWLNSFSAAKGEYIAICEGDDFWIRKDKLQTQYSLLSTEQNYNLVFSSAKSLFPDGTIKSFCLIPDASKIISLADCLYGTRVDFFPTASFFMRSTIIKELPQWFFDKAPVGDYFLVILAAKFSGALYIKDATTVYRRESNTSISVSNMTKWTSIQNQRIECIKLFINEHKNKHPHVKIILNLKITSLRYDIFWYELGRRSFIKALLAGFNLMLHPISLYSLFYFKKTGRYRL